MKSAIVLGLEDRTSLGIIRSLGKEKISIYGINLDGNRKFTYYSKYLIDKYELKHSNSDEELLKLLKNEKKFKNGYLFPTSDRTTKFLLDYQEQLLDSNLYNIYSKYTSKQLLDKEFQKEIAPIVGFNVPKTYSLSNLKFIEHIKFPLVLKPKNSLQYDKSSFRIINNLEELKKCLSHVNFELFFVEEFIPGESEAMIEILALRDHNRITHIPCIIQKERQYPPNIGSSSFIRTKYVEELIYPIKNLLDKLDFIGLVDVELKYDSISQKYYYIETNFRAGAPIYLSTVAGYNICYHFIKGVDSGKKHQCRDNVRWMNDANDWKNVFKGCTLIKFIRDVFSTKAFAIFNFYDPIPWIIFILKKLKNYPITNL